MTDTYIVYGLTDDNGTEGRIVEVVFCAEGHAPIHARDTKTLASIVRQSTTIEITDDFELTTIPAPVTPAMGPARLPVLGSRLLNFRGHLLGVEQKNRAKSSKRRIDSTPPPLDERATVPQTAVAEQKGDSSNMPTFLAQTHPERYDGITIAGVREIAFDVPIGEDGIAFIAMYGERPDISGEPRMRRSRVFMRSDRSAELQEGPEFYNVRALAVRDNEPIYAVTTAEGENAIYFRGELLGMENESVGSPDILDGKPVYTAFNKGRAQIVYDGNKSQEYNGVLFPTLINNKLAYIAEFGGGEWCVVFDGVESIRKYEGRWNNALDYSDPQGPKVASRRSKPRFWTQVR